MTWRTTAAMAMVALPVLGCREEHRDIPAPAAASVASTKTAPAPSATPKARPIASSSPPLAPSAATTRACPPDMVLVTGNACPRVHQRCLSWLDDPKLPYARCARYDREVRCIGDRKPLRFCIERDELTLPGERLPASDLSFVKARALCEGRGRRMCLESEWTFACEGEEIRPYPYGFERRPVCNQDREQLVDPSGAAGLADQRAASDAFPECVSPFGLRNMVGNVDELVARDGVVTGRFRNLLKGGWWMPARNRCRPATGDHDDHFHELQIGTRCCADASDAPRTDPTRN